MEQKVVMQIAELVNELNEVHTAIGELAGVIERDDFLTNAPTEIKQALLKLFVKGAQISVSLDRLQEAILEFGEGVTDESNNTAE